MTESKSSRDQDIVVKTFKNLEEEVIKNKICCSCGACVSYCESQAFDVIQMDDFTPRFKSDKNAENCKECGLCYFICPQTEVFNKKLDEASKVTDPLGPVINIFAGKTTNEAIEKLGQDGGIVTTILSYLFRTNKIDGAIVSEFDEELHTIPKIIFKEEELLNSAGTRYTISSQLLPLKDLYNLPEKVLEEKGIYDIDAMRLAFVGTPCQVRAVRKMKLLHIKPAHVIKYILSLFCYENFDYTKLYKIIEQETKVPSDDIKKTWIKKDFFLKDNKENEYQIGIRKLNDAVRNHCHVCDEFTGRFSDVSIGASGAPQGYSMIITRTETGEKLINSLISNKLIQQFMVPAEEASDWKEKKVKNLNRMISLKCKNNKK